MPGKAKKGDTPMTGPDWNDVGMLLRAVESTHSATLELKLRAGGAKYSGSVYVELKVTLPRLIAPGQPWSFTLCSEYPSNRAKTMQGLCFFLIYQADHKIGQQGYKQAELPLSPPFE